MFRSVVVLAAAGLLLPSNKLRRLERTVDEDEGPSVLMDRSEFLVADLSPVYKKYKSFGSSPAFPFIVAEIALLLIGVRQRNIHRSAKLRYVTVQCHPSFPSRPNDRPTSLYASL